MFERPIVNHESVAGCEELDRLQGKNGIFVCGSYATTGVPLLETAVSSAVRIAEQLGVDCPWEEELVAIKTRTTKLNSVFTSVVSPIFSWVVPFILFYLVVVSIMAFF